MTRIYTERNSVPVLVLAPPASPAPVPVAVSVIVHPILHVLPAPRIRVHLAVAAPAALPSPVVIEVPVPAAVGLLPPLVLPLVLLHMRLLPAQLEPLLDRVRAQRPHSGADHGAQELVPPLRVRLAVAPVARRRLGRLVRSEPADQSAQHTHADAGVRVGEVVLHDVLHAPDGRQIAAGVVPVPVPVVPRAAAPVLGGRRE